MATPVNTNTSANSSVTDYSKYEEALAKKVASTKEVSTPDTSILANTTGNLTGVQKDVGTAAVENYRVQQEAAKKQAESAASGLELAGAATLDYAQNIDALKQSVAKKVESASESFNRAPAQAEEYVQKANQRVTQVLDKLDAISDEFGKERSFAKAHDMQVAVQSVLGSMKAEERNIMEVYGAESPEYMQFKQSKQSTLATAQSNIHASYQKLAEEQKVTYMSAVESAYTKSNMYLGYQEQQHVEMLKWADSQKAAYELEASQLEISLEQAKLGGLENIANWIIQTPTFTMDATPLVTLLADLAQAQEANQLARSQMNAGKNQESFIVKSPTISSKEPKKYASDRLAAGIAAHNAQFGRI